ncbi:membrane protein [Desulforamulus profundi]|uniref:Membrane protein n=1 Tax=Desulforamulus profundi TaxID=1383067 RepID=A0A2C6MBP9_9FIRM|nr:TolC family protein [Desulforamulus profundi]PHJ39857.1 membrane protein [Desulforamulus profundi]
MKQLAKILIFVMSLLLLTQTVHASEITKSQLTLDQAIAKALTNSKKVEKATKEIDRLKEIRDYRNDQLGYTPIGSPDNKYTEMAWSNLLSTDLQWRMAMKSLDTEQDTVALNTCLNYWKVQQAIMAVDVAKESLNKANLDLLKSQASYKFGLITNEAYLGAETKQKSAKTAFEKAKNDLDTTYAKFNQLIGLRPEDRPELLEEVTFNPIGEQNIEYVVTKVLETSPDVWLANENVNLQKYLADLTMYTGEYRPYEARKIEVEKADLDAVSAKEAADLLTRSLYYNIRTLEEKHPTVEKSLDLAQESLRIAEIKYQVGLATKSDVATAKVSLVEAKLSLLALKSDHAYLKLALQKPWAYLKAGS